jgi:DNA (cytosine-5)-methyltransferase 1
VIKTQPKKVGPLVLGIVGAVESNGTPKFARAVATVLLEEKIRIRNKDLVTLTRPKDLSIAGTVALVRCHLQQNYRQFAPRLPQIVIYAVYRCLVTHVARYKDCDLEPLGRMKSADRKANTIGDVVVRKNKMPIEAVEIKHGRPIGLVDVSEAIDKVRALSVRRYYMLSTSGADENESDKIEKRKEEFLKQNGCEIIINGVVDSLSYYLRLLPDTNEFIVNYTSILEADSDTAYEHRVAWNSCCERM